MSKKFLFFFVGCALLILFIVFGLIGYQDKELGVVVGADAESAPTSPTQATGSLSGSQRAEGPSNATTSQSADSMTSHEASASGAEVLREFVRAGLNAYSAGEYARSLRELVEYEPHYAAMKARDLKEAFCNPDHISAALYIGTPDELIDDRKAYCEDLEGAVIAEILDIADSQHPGSDEYVDKLLTDHPHVANHYVLEDRLASASDDERSDVFTELARSAGTPEEIMDLIAMNLSSARKQGSWPVWELGQDNRQKHYPLANLSQAQTVALQLYICERFGGCGQEQLVRMIWCGMNRFGGPCPPGTSVEDLLYMTTPPADWLLAEEILRRLRRP